MIHLLAESVIIYHIHNKALYFNSLHIYKLHSSSPILRLNLLSLNPYWLGLKLLCLEGQRLWQLRTWRGVSWPEWREKTGRSSSWGRGASPLVGMREPALCCAAFYRPQGWVYFRKEKGVAQQVGAAQQAGASQTDRKGRGCILFSWGLPDSPR